MNIDDLQTGDIILVNDYQPGLFGMFLSMIRYGTHSDYVHVGMIVKDPTFLEKPLKEYIYGNLDLKEPQIHKMVKLK